MNINRDDFKSYLRQCFPESANSTIEGICTDAFYLKNDGASLGMDFQEIIIKRKIPDYFTDKLELFLKSRRKNPKGDAIEYKKRLQYLLNYLDYCESNRDKKFIFANNSNKTKIKEINLPNPDHQIKQNVLNEFIDNVIMIKMGLRILLGVLEPVVIDGLKEEYKDDWWKKGVLGIIHSEREDDFVEEKLDITLCFSLLVYNKYWNKIFKKRIKGDENDKKIKSYIQGLKIDRNINAHDLLEGISDEDAEITLKIISRLCKAFGSKEATNKIKRIISTLKINKK